MKWRAAMIDSQRVKRKAYYSLLKNKLVTQYARDVIRTNQNCFLHRYLASWYELYLDQQGQKSLNEAADHHRLKVVFSKFMQSYKVFSVAERQRRAMHSKAYDCL